MNTWICDNCGELIQRAEDGWVEWLSTHNEHGNSHGRGLRLVHHLPASPHHSCQYDEDEEFRRDGSILMALPLEQFLGPDGLMLLLSKLARDELPKDEVLEMIKRLHIPGYEHARQHFQRAIADGVFEPNMPDGYYWQSNIDAVLRFLEREENQ
jgi:hypothetical protein